VGASDIHVEPLEGRLRVRVRVDGQLREMAELPVTTAPAVVSRLKIMGDLDIASKRVPQDGRATVRVQGRLYALRLSTLPTQMGEKVVLRILDPENSATPLDQLGMSASNLACLRVMLQSPHGLILVTGPTGSGKTTTLYSALASLDRERRNLITLEDPVEYRLPGVTQVQVHQRAGLDFATSLRALLRQDPDVIMVGELRDRETVEVALAAAATGHLVLSTLHTNDAPSTITRLLNMGAPPYLLASALVGVLAQRLVRRVCAHCQQAQQTTAEEKSCAAQARPRKRHAVPG
jgi:type II secretory ATPase GspE/PulE/Tfp pilus assembly ATPase PilB-like protein